MIATTSTMPGNTSGHGFHGAMVTTSLTTTGSPRLRPVEVDEIADVDRLAVVVDLRVHAEQLLLRQFEALRDVEEAVALDDRVAEGNAVPVEHGGGGCAGSGAGVVRRTPLDDRRGRVGHRLGGDGLGLGRGRRRGDRRR